MATPGEAPLRAPDYQRPDDQARAVAEAADAAVAEAIDSGWDMLRHAALGLAGLTALVAAADWVAIYRIVGVAEVAEVMQPALTRLVDVHDQAARAETQEIAAAAARGSASASPAIEPEPQPAAAATPVSYDPLDAATVAEQQAARQATVQRLAGAAKATLDQVIQDGIANRLPPAELARNIRDLIGLTDRQAAAVENFRLALREADRSALDRALRDRRFDASVRRAIEGEPLDEAKIERMVHRYAERYQAFRAATIARTETLRTANAGRRAAWLQYAERRRIDPADIVRFWQTAADERVCPVCRAIPLLNPAGVPIGEAYASPDGDVDLPPEHTNCRCTERYEVRSGMQSRPGTPWPEIVEIGRVL